jgi:hypothetical protein
MTLLQDSGIHASSQTVSEPSTTAWYRDSSSSLQSIPNPVLAKNVGSQVHVSGFSKLVSMFGSCANPHLILKSTRQTYAEIHILGWGSLT